MCEENVVLGLHHIAEVSQHSNYPISLFLMILFGFFFFSQANTIQNLIPLTEWSCFDLNKICMQLLVVKEHM